MVMHHHEPDWPPKRLVCCVQGEGHSEGTYNQNMILYCIFQTADPSATKPGVMVHQLDRLVKRLACSVVINVKVTGKVKHSGERSSG